MDRDRNGAGILWKMPTDAERAQAAQRVIADQLGVTGWQVIKRDAGSLVGSGRWQGQDVVVKWWSSAGPLGALRIALGRGRADRHVAGTKLLLEAGIAAARVLTLVNHRPGPARGQFVIMQRLPGKTLLQHLADGRLSVRQQHALARSAGRLVQALCDASLNNRDGKPSNIIVTSVSDQDAELAFIDTVGVRRCRLGPPPIAVMLKNLLVEPLGCGVLPRRSLIMRGYRWDKQALDARRSAQAAEEFDDLSHEAAREDSRMNRRVDWDLIAQLIREHGDPRPKINPLSIRTPQ